MHPQLDMTSTRFPSSCLVTLALAVASPALAQESTEVTVQTRDTDDRGLPTVRSDSPSGRFGVKRQKAVSSDAGLSISNTSIDDVDGSTTTLVLRPAVDWFFADDISLGGFVGLEYNSSPGGDSTVISIGPRIGYNLPISERTSVWPKAGLAFASTSFSEDDDGLDVDNDESNTSLQLNLFVPFMFHPVPHFFLGLGPALDQDLSGDSKATTIAARLTLGGWI
jgi:hypothetical protein